MNPFECIKEMKKTLGFEIQQKNIKENDTISQKEHYTRMLNMLDILEKEIKDAEYNYEVESIKHEVKVFDDTTVLQKQLNDDVIIFQPIAIDDADLYNIDMYSLADVLRQLHDSGKIKEDMLILPPNINVFRAKLALYNTKDKE